MYKSTDFKDVRVASLGNFSIYYKVTEKSILITAFWDNRQDPRKLIDFLKQLQNKTILFNLADNIKYYNEDIDIDRLQKNRIDDRNISVIYAFEIP